MARVKIKFQGWDRNSAGEVRGQALGSLIQKSWRKVTEEQAERMDTAVAKTTFEIHKAMTDQLQGRTERPHQRTGELKRLTQVAPKTAPMKRTIVSLVYYAPFVEFGTARNRAYPFFYSTARRYRRRLKELVKGAIKG